MKQMLGIILALVGGCASTSYTPYRLDSGELWLSQSNGLVVNQGSDALAREPRFRGLLSRVGCAPTARIHAAAARREGRTTTGLATAGSLLGVASLGGLGGLAYMDSNPRAAGAILGSGLVIGLVGVAMAAGSRRHRVRANGHAVDAVNYYNDERESPPCKAAALSTLQDLSGGGGRPMTSRAPR